ncbi:MAG: hypothetical protein L0Y71_01135 [Gemmataceae bacterium]|nr:hypothetical protein [Gemmataceae bacterium]
MPNALTAVVSAVNVTLPANVTVSLAATPDATRTSASPVLVTCTVARCTPADVFCTLRTVVGSLATRSTDRIGKWCSTSSACCRPS